MSKRRHPRSPCSPPQKNLKLDITDDDRNIIENDAEEPPTLGIPGPYLHHEQESSSEYSSIDDGGAFSIPSYARALRDDTTDDDPDFIKTDSQESLFPDGSIKEEDLWDHVPPMPWESHFVAPGPRYGVAPVSSDEELDNFFLEDRGSARSRGFDPCNLRNRDHTISFSRHVSPPLRIPDLSFRCETSSEHSSDYDMGLLTRSGARLPRRSYVREVPQHRWRGGRAAHARRRAQQVQSDSDHPYLSAPDSPPFVWVRAHRNSVMSSTEDSEE